MNREIEAAFDELRGATGTNLRGYIDRLYDLVEAGLESADERISMLEDEAGDLQDKVNQLTGDLDLEECIHTLLDCLDRTGVRRHTLPDTGEARAALLQLHYAVGRQP